MAVAHLRPRQSSERRNSATAASKVNDALDLGWVRLVENPAHKRSSLVRITPAGAAGIGAVVDREHRTMTRVGGDLTGREVDAALRVLGEMLAALERVESDDTGH